jgi:16S rRNA (uracil1498-N3)-methyltransferase
VLRLRPGDPAVVLNGTGAEWQCELASATSPRAILRVLERRQHPPPAVRLTLFQAVTKPRAMEWTIQKATELSVDSLVPIAAERSVSHLGSGQAENRREKWVAIAVEALKQCGGSWIPSIAVPAPIRIALSTHLPSDLEVIGSLDPTARPLKAVFAGFRQAHARAPGSVAAWIGPEGDFTPEETGLITGRGAVPVTLGSRTLRAETAALVAVAVLRHELEPGPAPIAG